MYVDDQSGAEGLINQLLQNPTPLKSLAKASRPETVKAVAGEERSLQD